ncbi:MAG: DUF6503 family protein [bacterium]
MRLILLPFLLAMGCSSPTTNDVIPTDDEKTTAPVTPAESGQEPTAPSASLGSRSVDARVADAKSRLASTPAGQLMWSAIEAHGGLQKWLEGGTITFRFTYTPVDTSKPPNDTRQWVDLWNAHAKHTLVAKPEISFGWDGQQAWVSPPGADPGTNPRFWSLTPYYFVGVPFVLADPGVILTQEADAEFEGKTYHVVRATFEAGVGDASGDYYVVYIDPETSRVRGLRYIVSYKGFFPNGGHTPEKLMAYDGAQTIEGITLPTSFRTFAWDGGKVGDLVTNTTLTEVSFRPDITDFSVPPGAEIRPGY